MIMVIDDFEGLFYLIENIIKQSYDTSVVFFICPQKAISFFKDNHENVEVIISDFNMPNMNGCELINNLKSIDPNIKMGIMSGYMNESGELLRGYEWHNSDFFIRKPFSVDSIKKH